MDSLYSYLAAISVVGTGATAISDIWGFLRKPLLGVAPPNYCFVGRWFGHMPRGTFLHRSISASPPIPGECVLGWVAHYLTGLVFASILLLVSGLSWTQQPTLGPALAVGVGTLIAPFLLMQPGMGAGIASARTPRPWAARLQSFITHVVFGFGLYLGGLMFSYLSS